MSRPTPRCREYGDAGLLVEFGDGPFAERWAAARALGESLRSRPPTGLTDVVAAFDTVLVELDPLVTTPDEISLAVADLARHEVEVHPGRELLLPVAYGGPFGPDLEQLAELLDLTPEGVVALHTAEPWTVRFVGSPLGAPLMDGPRLPRTVPRVASPRGRLEPGSVGISGHQTIVYNAPSPGGWQLVGRTPLRLFDLEPPHVGYRAGDRLRMVPITPADWDDLAGMPLADYQTETAR